MPTSRQLWGHLLANELRQRQAPDAIALMRLAGMVPDAWQLAAAQSQAQRQLWLCARQTGKSSLAAAMALGQALQVPNSLTLLLSPSLRQSQELFQKVRDLHRALPHPLPLTAESALRYALHNGARLLALPATESTIRGYSGVQLLVVDEAARVPDDLFYSVKPMLAVSQGRMACLSTAWGKRGWFYQEWAQGEGWERTRVPASSCPRIPATFLAQERLPMPRTWYESEYECLFVDTDQNVFSEADLQRMLDPSVEVWDFLRGGEDGRHGRF